MSTVAQELLQQWRQANAYLVANDVEAALDLFETLARQGLPAAMSDLGRLHVLQMIPEPSFERGLDLLSRAAQAGYPEASYFLATVAAGDRLLAFNPRQIAHWVQLSAQAGYPAALRTLALHWGRFGTPGLHALGTLCLEHAAVNGDPTSLALLGERLAKGDGCTQDLPRAEAIAQLLSRTRLPVAPPAQPTQASPQPARLPPLPLLPLMDLHPALAPAARENLHDSPLVAVARDVLNAEECRFVTLLGGPMLRQSVAVDPNGEIMQVQLRTSRDMVFDSVMEDVSLRLIQRRMAACAGLPLSHSEPLVLLHYEPGQEYRPHRDYLPPSRITPVADGGAGQRKATVIAYLNEVEQGGRTEFPLLDLTVEPRRGSVLAFHNLDGLGNPEPLSLHAGLPVEAGVKWICTLWIHEAPFRSA